MKDDLKRKAEEFCVEMGAQIKMRSDGKPITIENLRAIAEVNAKIGFLAGVISGLEAAAELFEGESCIDHENEMCVAGRIRALAKRMED
jgi:hypothetical protein